MRRQLRMLIEVSLVVKLREMIDVRGTWNVALIRCIRHPSSIVILSINHANLGLTDSISFSADSAGLLLRQARSLRLVLVLRLVWSCLRHLSSIDSASCHIFADNKIIEISILDIDDWVLLNFFFSLGCEIYDRR